MPQALEDISYTVGAVTLAEMLRAVGLELRLARLNRKWTASDVEQAGGPSYKTVLAIEDGKGGNIESLDRCARALELSIVDVIFSVLMSRKTALSPEAARVVQKFNETTIDGRTALLSVANALPPAAAASGTAPLPAAAATPATHRPPRPGRPAAKRRTAE